MLLDLLSTLPTTSKGDLLEAFQEEGSGDYYTWYMRALTAARLRSCAERFFPFVADENTFDMKTYTEREVEPMGKESEQVSIMALAEYLQVQVHISYVDGHACPPSTITLPSSDSGAAGDAAMDVRLLYRPGHYDILYCKRESNVS